ncbi:MAG TPA: hypothetical protein VFO60_00620 [Candidatus Dormibacteraeota bacterium]|nr:hypothetical protein [Candidatus Dormibacteraeota bacterium]
MDVEELRISGFTNREWAAHAVEELRSLGMTAELDSSATDAGASWALRVSGCPELMAMLRPLSDGVERPAGQRVPAFDWCSFVSTIGEPPAG